MSADMKLHVTFMCHDILVVDSFFPQPFKNAENILSLWKTQQQAAGGIWPMYYSLPTCAPK